MINLIHGDCLVAMKDIPDKSVDMILCDLPYEVLHKNNPHAQGMFTAELMMSNPKMWRYNLVWDKVAKNGFLNANRMPLRQHEDICVFYKQLPTYNPQMTKCEPHKRNHSKGSMAKQGKNSCYGDFVEVPTRITDEKYPTSIISISKEHKVGNFFHPTQKSVALLEYLIKTYSNEGETILDNTMGSGSSGVAAKRLNRNFIGIELNEEYFKIAVKRIQQTIQQLFYDDNKPCKQQYV